MNDDLFVPVFRDWFRACRQAEIHRHLGHVSELPEYIEAWNAVASYLLSIELYDDLVALGVLRCRGKHQNDFSYARYFVCLVVRNVVARQRRIEMLQVKAAMNSPGNADNQPPHNTPKEIDSELFPQGKIDNPALEEYATLVWENRNYRRVNKMDLARLITGEPRGDNALAKALQNSFRTYQANGRIAKVPRSQG